MAATRRPDMVSRTCKTFHGRRWVWAVDRRFDEMNDVKFNAANLSRCTHRRILNAHVALNGGFRHASASELSLFPLLHNEEGGYPVTQRNLRDADGRRHKARACKHVGII